MSDSCHTLDSAVVREQSVRHIYIAGNPNSGKSTVFNLLTGMRQQVGNYPGVTVERKSGRLLGSNNTEIIDLPGSYSLNPKSLDEQIAYEALANHLPDEAEPDLVICVINATNLERNLYLASQILDMALPTIVVLNMMDEVAESGKQIDLKRLEHELGAPVVPMIATKREGIDRLLSELDVAPRTIPEPKWLLDERVASVVEALAATMGDIRPHLSLQRRKAESLRLLTSDRLLGSWEVDEPDYVATVRTARAKLVSENIPYAQAEVTGRYMWLGQLTSQVVSTLRSVQEKTFSDRLDAVLVHRLFGPIIFGLLLMVVFQSIFTWATPVMDLIESGMTGLGTLVRTVLPPMMITDLLVDGVIAGVGNVIVFLPQILLLFFFLNLMESTGYMARSAFIMDRVMRRVGLTGGAVMPLMSGFACAIPAIMATRTMESQRDRFLTIMVVPLMSCSARLPVYTLFIAAFIPSTKFFGPIGYQGLTMLSLYLLGTVMTFVAAGVLGKIFKGPKTSFVIELPPYRRPQWKFVFWRMFDRAKIFVVSAGQIIFFFSIILWFAASFPKMDTPERIAVARATLEQERTGLAPTVNGSIREARLEEELAQLDNQEASLQMEQSFIGRLGRIIEPVMRPLGYDWKLSAGIISAFAAREVIIGALATIYSVGDADENSLALRDHLRNARDPVTGQPTYTPLVAMSMLVFFVLALQCTSTLAIARRELNSWKWPVFMWLYMTGLAYIAAFIVYQGGLALGWG